MAFNCDLLNDALNDILTCVCTVLESGLCDECASPCGCPCRMFVSAGPPVWDNEACCGDGQLTAHIDRIYPYKNFPAQTNEIATCAMPLAADVVVTLLRCWPANIKDDGSAPTSIEIKNASEQAYRDFLLMSKGVICCLSAKGKRLPFVFTGARIVGPDGGCIGIEARYVVSIEDPWPFLD